MSAKGWEGAINNLTFSPEAIAVLQALVAPSWVDIGGLIIGLAQCGLIFYGLRLMSQGSSERTAQLTAQHEETMTSLKAQHEETMTVLKELILRTAPRP